MILYLFMEQKFYYFFIIFISTSSGVIKSLYDTKYTLIK